MDWLGSWLNRVIGGSNGEWRSRRSCKELLAPMSVVRIVESDRLGLITWRK